MLINTIVFSFFQRPHMFEYVRVSVRVHVYKNRQIFNSVHLFFKWYLRKRRRRKQTTARNAINSYFVALVAFHSIIIVIFSVYISTFLLRWRLSFLFFSFIFYLSLSSISVTYYFILIRCRFSTQSFQPAKKHLTHPIQIDN